SFAGSFSNTQGTVWLEWFARAVSDTKKMALFEIWSASNFLSLFVQKGSLHLKSSNGTTNPEVSLDRTSRGGKLYKTAIAYKSSDNSLRLGHTGNALKEMTYTNTLGTGSYSMNLGTAAYSTNEVPFSGIIKSIHYSNTAFETQVLKSVTRPQ
ncbi:MAG: hypothetical protein AB7H97_21335, partial [Pseudobdellovibrionaceae bacterium]